MGSGYRLSAHKKLKKQKNPGDKRDEYRKECKNMTGFKFFTNKEIGLNEQDIYFGWITGAGYNEEKGKCYTFVELCDCPQSSFCHVEYLSHSVDSSFYKYAVRMDALDDNGDLCLDNMQGRYVYVTLSISRGGTFINDIRYADEEEVKEELKSRGEEIPDDLEEGEDQDE